MEKKEEEEQDVKKKKKKENTEIAFTAHGEEKEKDDEDGDGAVLSVAVFVMRNKFVKKEEADLCLNLYPCVIKHSYYLSLCPSVRLSVCHSVGLSDICCVRVGLCGSIRPFLLARFHFLKASLLQVLTCINLSE